MLLHMNFFGAVHVRGDPTSYRQPCEEAYRDFLVWKRANKVTSSQRKFSFWSVFKEEYGCYMNAKAYNSRVLSAWLESVLDRARSAPPPGLTNDDRLYTCLVTLSPSIVLTSKVFWFHCGGVIRRELQCMWSHNTSQHPSIPVESLRRCPRKAVNRYFQLTELASRAMQLVL